MVKKSLLILIFLVFLSACAGVATVKDRESKERPDKEAFSQFKKEDRKTETSRGNDSVRRLLIRVDEEERQGNIEKAISNMERAIRIQPQNAFLWHRLAALYYTKGDYQRAIQFARRSNSFSSSDMSQRELNRQLIENAEGAMLGRN